VRASGLRTNALIKLDLPTLDRPTRATSGSRSRGKSRALAALVTNSAEIRIYESTNRHDLRMEKMKMQSSIRKPVDP
jgi:hypothetical protein